jgi:hypothetical protein
MTQMKNPIKKLQVLIREYKFKIVPKAATQMCAEVQF